MSDNGIVMNMPEPGPSLLRGGVQESGVSRKALSYIVKHSTSFSCQCRRLSRRNLRQITTILTEVGTGGEERSPIPISVMSDNRIVMNRPESGPRLSRHGVQESGVSRIV